MNHLNKVIIQGNLTKDPELKDLGSSKLTKFTLASNRRYKDKEEACFVDIIAWGNLAALCDKYLSRGKPVLIEGRLKQDKWETPDGQKRSKLTVVASEVVFLPSNENKTTKDDTQSRPIKSTVHTGSVVRQSPMTVEDVKNDIGDLPF